jgi:hypothetical protein
MSDPRPAGEDERPPAGPGAGMGLPESGTQHATSTDFTLPTDPPALPVYEDPAQLADPLAPAYDEPTDLVDAVPDVEATELAAAGTPAYDALAAETAFEPAGPAEPSGAAGVLAKVKAFADERPAAFLAAALVAGWLVGKLLGSSDDDDDEG